MILSRAWLHDTVSCAAWNDARKGVYLKPLFKTPCSNCYWGWSKPIMMDYRDISLMESVPLLWRTVTALPVGIEPMTILEGGGPYNWYLIHWRREVYVFHGLAPQYPLWLCWSTENSGSWRYLSWWQENLDKGWSLLSGCTAGLMSIMLGTRVRGWLEKNVSLCGDILKPYVMWWDILGVH